MKRILVAAVAALGMFGCDKPSAEGFNIPGPKDLKPGGVYVAYNHGCDKGCDQVDKGDLIQKVDGKTVKTGEDIDAANLVDGKPHKLELLAAGSLAPKSVEVVANDRDPAIKAAATTFLREMTRRRRESLRLRNDCSPTW